MWVFERLKFIVRLRKRALFRLRYWRASLEDAARELDAQPPPHSDAWLELGEELQQACRRVASASHCLHEWAEPIDARADLDSHVEASDATLDQGERARRRTRRAGRRNIGLWAQPPAG